MTPACPPLRDSSPPGHRRRAVRASLVALVLVQLAGSPAFSSSEPCTDSTLCRDQLALRRGGTLAYFRTLRPDRNEAVRRAVIVVHGNRRDADRYFEHLVAAARAEERLGDTALLAPAFGTLDDERSKSELHWSSHGWKIGDKSRDATRTSSFAALDELLAQVCGLSRTSFPQIQKVAIVGHSAGGQFVNRYAAGGAGCSDRAVEVHYVVMNPSSYLYLDGRRRADGAADFEVPRGGCRGYDDYKYGLRDLNSYMERVGPDRIRQNLFTRRVYYLAGEEDTRGGSSLDTSCRANLQGSQRLARFTSYRDYSRLFDEWTGSVFATIPGIGHDGARMLMSDTTRRVLFR